MPDTIQLVTAAMLATLIPGSGPLAPVPAPGRPASGPALSLPSSGPNTLPGDTLPSARDSAAAAPAARLDSLRQRVAELRAVLLRLRAELGVRIERRTHALRIVVPVSVADGNDPRVRFGAEALVRVASVVRRYYPDARVSVLGAAAGGGESCASPATRRRAAAAVRHLSGPGGLDAARVHRARCGRTVTPEPAPADPGAEVPAASAVTLVVAIRGD